MATEVGTELGMLLNIYNEHCLISAVAHSGVGWIFSRGSGSHIQGCGDGTSNRTIHQDSFTIFSVGTYPISCIKIFP